MKSYSFKTAGGYSASDVEGVRRQLGPGWEKIVNVRSKKSDNVEIYVLPAGNNAAGLVIIASEPLELTIVQLLGNIDMQKLGSLDGQLGIPDLDIQVSKK